VIATYSVQVVDAKAMSGQHETEVIAAVVAKKAEREKESFSLDCEMWTDVERRNDCPTK
jgi:hypothetical protein